jgi:hypothetical protein
MGLLAEKQPTALWQSLSRFYERASSLERDWLEQLVGPSEHGEDMYAEGVLFKIPQSEILTWANIDPGARVPFLCTFYPMLVKNQEGAYTWHPAFETLASEFGRVEAFRDTIADRLQPSSWSGSKVPILEGNLPPLEKWFEHPIGTLAQWARDTHRSLEREIASERRYDAEN